MKVICEGFLKGCNSIDCDHKIPHEHSIKYPSCDDLCCSTYPYKCSEKTYNLYIRKLKIKEINEKNKER
jgi:hypothetical protein